MEFAVTLKDILPAGAPTASKYVVYEYWDGFKSAVVCDEEHPFHVPAPALSPDPAVIVSSFHVFAPVLSNGWALLGETGKFVPASSKRVRRLSLSRDSTSGTGIDACLVGVEGEQFAVAARAPNGAVLTADCIFSEGGEGQVGLHCSAEKCSCAGPCASVD